MRRERKEALIRTYLQALYKAWGDQHWWPADSRFEVIVGAYLTQNTAWTNVELALANLRASGLLNLATMRQAPLADLEQAIRPAGYFRQKAARLKTFIAHLDKNYAGSLERMFAQPTEELRMELLALNGVGPETADSILLYAGNHEVFVVDAYTRRILDRHRILPEAARYEEVRALFEGALTPAFASAIAAQRTEDPTDKRAPQAAYHSPSAMSEETRSERAQLLNEMHALIVGVGKDYCQSRTVLCDRCPLGAFLERPVKLKPRQARRLGSRLHAKK